MGQKSSASGIGVPLSVKGYLDFFSMRNKLQLFFPLTDRASVKIIIFWGALISNKYGKPEIGTYHLHGSFRIM